MKHRNLLIAIVIVLVVSGCLPVSQSSVNSGSKPKALKLIDLAYESGIKSVVLHPGFADPEVLLQPAVTSIGKWNLVLEFDDLAAAKDDYSAKVIHCNYDWTKSSLMDLDFMTEYNDFPINNYEFSNDTHIPYVHYWFPVPPVKLPGNYVLIVFRGGDKEDVILSKRFMVFDTQVRFVNEMNLVGAGTQASLNQQINFTINYKNLDIINPLENVKVVIRQNQRWDNLASDVRPSFVREIEKEIEYRFFDASKMFKGGNEFRFFDLRSLDYPGRNVQRVDKSVKPYEAYIERDKPRPDEAYGQYVDFNGGFILENLDYRDASFSNYAFVNFTLASKPIKGDVFVSGAFHQWNLNQENRMVYDSSRSEYHARLLLKQGWYDYHYLVRSPDLPPLALEGSHFETENTYEIFVYYRPLQPQADLLIGYLRLEKNPR